MNIGTTYFEAAAGQPGFDAFARVLDGSAIEFRVLPHFPCCRCGIG